MAIDVGAVKLDSPYLVRDVGVRLSTAADEVASRAGDIRSSWAGLASLYEAPEQSLVLAAMDVPDTEAGEFSDKSLRVQGALSTYADALEGLQARKATLMSDVEQFYAEKAEVEADNADNNFLETGKDWLTGEDNDLLEREEGLLARVGELQAEKDAAERACANTIGAIWGAPDYSAADETTVWDENVYGMSEEGYEQAALSGDTPWGHPDMWSDGDWTTKVFMLQRGAERSITGLFEFGGDLIGVDGGGQAKAAWSGLAQLGGDALVMSPLGAPFTSLEQKAESSERLLGVGKAMIGWDTWGTSGWNTAGGLGLDVALTAATFGYGGAAKGGARAATATSGVRRVVGPLSASRAGQMASALRVNLSSRASTALNTLRHLPDDTARSFNRFMDNGQPALAGAPGRHLDDFAHRMDSGDRPGSGVPDSGRAGSGLPEGDGPGVGTPDADSPGPRDPGGAGPSGDAPSPRDWMWNDETRPLPGESAAEHTERTRGIDRGDNRDTGGKYTGSDTQALANEAEGLRQFADDAGVEVIDDQVVARFEGMPQNGRKYDGLYDLGTIDEATGLPAYGAIEVKGPTATYGGTQRAVDDMVNGGQGAVAVLNGKEIIIVEVKLHVVRR